jgi:hypothetical protein
MARLIDIGLLAVGNKLQMAGAIYADGNKTYLCFFPEDNNDMPSEPLEMTLDDWKQFLRQTDILETEILARSSNGELAKAILRKSQRQIDQGISWRVFKRDGYRCRYCGLDNVPLTVDHLVCYEDGGPSIEENLVSSCRKCNKLRGNTPFERWLMYPRYMETSSNLTEEVRLQNEALVKTLDKIPRQYVRSR